jgi:hypothetical protein
MWPLAAMFARVTCGGGAACSKSPKPSSAPRSSNQTKIKECQENEPGITDPSLTKTILGIRVPRLERRKKMLCIESQKKVWAV